MAPAVMGKKPGTRHLPPRQQGWEGGSYGEDTEAGPGHGGDVAHKGDEARLAHSARKTEGCTRTLSQAAGPRPHHSNLSSLETRGTGRAWQVGSEEVQGLKPRKGGCEARASDNRVAADGRNSQATGFCQR